MESAIAVAQAVFFPWVGGVGGGRERREESRREQGPGCAELAWLTPQPLLPWEHPPISPTLPVLCLLSVWGSYPRKSGYKIHLLVPHHHLSLPQFQQHCPSQEYPPDHKIPHFPPPSPKSRCAPLINWGSESETTFSPSDLSRPHKNKKRYTPFPNFFLQILGIFGGSLKRLLESRVRGS